MWHVCMVTKFFYVIRGHHSTLNVSEMQKMQNLGADWEECCVHMQYLNWNTFDRFKNKIKL